MDLPILDKIVTFIFEDSDAFIDGNTRTWRDSKILSILPRFCYFFSNFFFFFSFSVHSDHSTVYTTRLNLHRGRVKLQITNLDIIHWIRLAYTREIFDYRFNNAWLILIFFMFQLIRVPAFRNFALSDFHPCAKESCILSKILRFCSIFYTFRRNLFMLLIIEMYIVWKNWQEEIEMIRVMRLRRFIMLFSFV